MNPMKPTLIAAVIAGLSFGSGAFAEEKSKSSGAVETPKAAAERGPDSYDSVRKEHVDRTKDATESEIENPKAAAERGPESYDSVRKEHVERNPATEKGYDSVRKEHVDRAVAPEQGAAGRSGTAANVRDWNTIDANNDNLISPDEMQAYLEKNTASQAKAAEK